MAGPILKVRRKLRQPTESRKFSRLDDPADENPHTGKQGADKQLTLKLFRMWSKAETMLCVSKSKWETVLKNESQSGTVILSQEIVFVIYNSRGKQFVEKSKDETASLTKFCNEFFGGHGGSFCMSDGTAQHNDVALKFIVLLSAASFYWIIIIESYNGVSDIKWFSRSSMCTLELSVMHCCNGLTRRRYEALQSLVACSHVRGVYEFRYIKFVSVRG